ncbi:MAG TPA: hypothetical protein VFY79_02500, partial [Dehalococcoidia bacterium]|nr:hypothetical protein [Dehalococcoidia bacterium]
ALTAAVALATAACGSPASEPAPAVTRTVDVSSLSFADVQQRTRAAATKPGMIFHITDSQHSDATGDTVVETWLDSERHLARIDRDGAVTQIFGPDKLAELSPVDGRYTEGGYSWPGLEDAPLIGFTLDYLGRLLSDRAKNTALKPAVVDGAPAIAVSVRQPAQTIDGPAITEHATVYLSEDFLPLKMDFDYGKGNSRTTHTYKTGYLQRDAVPANFFSFEQVRANAKTAAENLRAAAAHDFPRAYWLGERFEDVEMRSATASPLPSLNIPILRISYEAPDAGAGGPDAVFPCFSLTEYTRQGWDAIARARPPLPETMKRIERAQRTALDGQAMIFEVPADRVLQAPRIAGQPEPTPAPLAAFSVWTAEVMLPDMVVELRADCGPPDKNPYRSLAGIQHLLDSLQPLGVQ